jgi:hypothetical protein
VYLGAPEAIRFPGRVLSASIKFVRIQPSESRCIEPHAEVQ